MARRALTVVALAVAMVTPAPASAHRPGCNTRACDARVLHRERRAHWARRHPWQHRFNRLPARGRAWAKCVSRHESGNRRVARESGYLSYFQWTEGTWLNAGGHGNPEGVGWFEQAVRAWRWHVAHPVGQWPNTGEGGRCGG